MQVTPFLLDRWLNEHQFTTPPIEFDLAVSTGPRWTWREILSTLAPGAVDDMLDRHALYAPTTGSAELREAVAEMAGVPASEVIVVTGASEAIWIVSMVTAEPGANVVIPHPGYPTFDQAARHLGLTVRHYDVHAEGQFRVDVDEVDASIDDHTVLVIVNTPHNPTGAVVSDDELLKLHDVVAQRGAHLLVDEVYHPIYHGAASSSGARLPAATTIGDLSKALSISGLRIGWIIDHDPGRLAQFEDARAYLTISSSPLLEALAAGAIRARDTILDRAHSVAATNLPTLDKFVAEHADVLDWVRPGGGLTAFPWLRSGTDTRAMCAAAAAAGVLVAPGDCFGMPSHFRVGFGAAEDGFAEAISRLGDVLPGG